MFGEQGALSFSRLDQVAMAFSGVGTLYGKTQSIVRTSEKALKMEQKSIEWNAFKAEFNVTKIYMNPKQMSAYIRELESGFKNYGGNKWASSHKLTQNQLNALSENLKQTLTKTIPNATTNKAIINQLSNPRWRFMGICYWGEG